MMAKVRRRRVSAAIRSVDMGMKTGAEAPVCRKRVGPAIVAAAAQARSKRSRFITLVQAATKSLTNLSLPSALA